MSRTVIIPGLHNSGPTHWQSWLETRLPQSLRIDLPEWHEPRLQEWTEAVLSALSKEAPALLVAHSFGCLAAIRAASRFPAGVSGLLLVAPAHPGKFGLNPARFDLRLTARTVLVASDNDPWMSARHAAALADALGADFLNLSEAGHINAQSGYGPWPGGLKLVEGLQRPRVLSFRARVDRIGA